MDSWLRVKLTNDSTRFWSELHKSSNAGLHFITPLGKQWCIGFSSLCTGLSSAVGINNIVIQWLVWVANSTNVCSCQKQGYLKVKVS